MNMIAPGEDGARSHWESIYNASSCERLSWYQESPEDSLRLIKESGVLPDAAVIDAGGGASSLASCLLTLGFRDVSVLDCSEEAMAQARKRMDTRAGQVSWIRDDIRSFRTDRSFRLWHDRAVFHFMDSEEDRRRYLDTLDACLDQDGLAIIGTFALTGPSRCSRLNVEQYDAERIAGVFAPRFEILSSMGSTHQTPSGASQDFMFFTFRRKRKD